jgi:uracil-DNA glycosylase
MSQVGMSSSISGSTAKRSLSPTKSPSSPQKAAKIQHTSDIDDAFEEEFDFDQDALVEATLTAEKKEKNKMQSSSSQGTASSQGKASSSSASAKVNTVTPTTKMDKQAPKESMPQSIKASNLKHGDAKVEEETMDREWFNRLKGEMEKPYFVKLKSFLREESSKGKVIYPPANLIHSWSRLTPLSTVKVVILGQDPYHGPNQACGHSFSVAKGVPIPGSLRNIYKELSNEYGAAFKAPQHG